MNYSSNIIKPGDETGDFLPGELVKPKIFDLNEPLPVFGAGMDYRIILNKLETHNGILVHGSFPTALAFYTWLRKKFTSKYPVHNHISSRRTREIVAEKTNKIFVRISHHKIDLEKAPEIPWLKFFYPDRKEFLISLPDILGMNGAWQWYKNGIEYPVINHRIHPFYGVYFPTRTGHLLMFDKWLEKNRDRFVNAIDIGTGCGILSFIMAKHNIKTIHATDINPNAVWSTAQEVRRLGLKGRITVEQAPFFGSLEEFGGLAVFNPPWVPGKHNDILDKGIYYEKRFFDQFFIDVENKMKPGSTLAIIFSNYAVEAGITDNNPIEYNLKRSKKLILSEKITRQVDERTTRKSKTWINRIREKEQTELWILKMGSDQ
ncbi:MAG: methyltransferase [Bacteroidales bacterium]